MLLEKVAGRIKKICNLHHRLVPRTLGTPVCKTRLEILSVLKMYYFPIHLARILETCSCRRSLPGCLSSRFITFFKAALHSLQLSESVFEKNAHCTNGINTNRSPALALQILCSNVATTINCNRNFFQHMTLADDCSKIRVPRISD